MARIIDKEEKRCDIARASIDLFCEKGIAQTTIDEIAKSAGVAKGTIYLYFKNKEEIVFAIWDMVCTLHVNAFESSIKPEMGAKEKILEFFHFTAFQGEQEAQKIMHLYQHFVSALLIDKTGLYTAYFESFFQKDYDFILACLKEGVQKAEFIIDDIDMITKTMITLLKGILIMSKASKMNFQETQNSLNQHIIYLLKQYTTKDIKGDIQ